jgi:hypothetical protein
MLGEIPSPIPPFILLPFSAGKLKSLAVDFLVVFVGFFFMAITSICFAGSFSSQAAIAHRHLVDCFKTREMSIPLHSGFALAPPDALRYMILLRLPRHAEERRIRNGDSTSTSPARAGVDVVCRKARRFQSRFSLRFHSSFRTRPDARARVARRSLSLFYCDPPVAYLFPVRPTRAPSVSILLAMFLLIYCREKLLTTSS